MKIELELKSFNGMCLREDLGTIKVNGKGEMKVSTSCPVPDHFFFDYQGRTFCLSIPITEIAGKIINEQTRRSNPEQLPKAE